MIEVLGGWHLNIQTRPAVFRNQRFSKGYKNRETRNIYIGEESVKSNNGIELYLWRVEVISVFGRFRTHHTLHS